MADAYRQILDEVVAAVTGLATTGTSVYESPSDALAQDVLPALAVQPVQIEVEIVSESADSDNHLERHTLSLSIATIAESIAARDASALEVKVAILNDARPGWSRRYTRSDFAESNEGNRVLYQVRQRFDVTYHINAVAPDAIVKS